MEVFLSGLYLVSLRLFKKKLSVFGGQLFQFEFEFDFNFES